jgi:hypothetical protein
MTLPLVTSATWSVERYIDAWNQASRPQRLLILDECWAEDGTYVDRYTSEPVEGLVNLSAYIEYVRQGYPAHQFKLVESVERHHNYFQFHWTFCSPSGQSSIGGVDFGELDSAGRIHRVVRFHGITSFI